MLFEDETYVNNRKQRVFCNGRRDLDATHHRHCPRTPGVFCHKIPRPNCPKSPRKDTPLLRAIKTTLRGSDTEDVCTIHTAHFFTGKSVKDPELTWNAYDAVLSYAKGCQPAP